MFYRTDGLTLRGGGLIDGKGEKWWDLPCKPHKVCMNNLTISLALSSNQKYIIFVIHLILNC